MSASAAEAAAEAPAEAPGEMGCGLRAESSPELAKGEPMGCPQAPDPWLSSLDADVPMEEKSPAISASRKSRGRESDGREWQDDGPPVSANGSDASKDTEELTGSVGESRDRSRSATKSADFERFPDSLQTLRIPVIAFSDSVDEMTVWENGSIKDGEVQKGRRTPDLKIADPIAMSPAYLGFVCDPWNSRVLHYDGVSILFQRPPGGVFMQPSIDTVLLCCGLQRLFAEPGVQFHHALDIGSGSGFVGKYAAAKAPGSGELKVMLCDVDATAMQYCKTQGFHPFSQSHRGRPLCWQYHAGDAAALLQKKGASFDLLISNPPYIPTHEEVITAQSNRPNDVADHRTFWEGVGLIVFLIERFTAKVYPEHAHMLLVLTSLTLKAPSVVTAIRAAVKSGAVRVRALLEREVAWKAWYAGPWGNKYLMADARQEGSRMRVAKDLDLFIGATEPGCMRLQTVNDGRQYCQSFHWHVVYVLDFSYL